MPSTNATRLRAHAKKQIDVDADVKHRRVSQSKHSVAPSSKAEQLAQRLLPVLESDREEAQSTSTPLLQKTTLAVHTFADDAKLSDSVLHWRLMQHTASLALRSRHRLHMLTLSLNSHKNTGTSSLLLELCKAVVAIEQRSSVEPTPRSLAHAIGKIVQPDDACIHLCLRISRFLLNLLTQHHLRVDREELPSPVVLRASELMWETLLQVCQCTNSQQYADAFLNAVSGSLSSLSTGAPANALVDTTHLHHTLQLMRASIRRVVELRPQLCATEEYENARRMLLALYERALLSDCSFSQLRAARSTCLHSLPPASATAANVAARRPRSAASSLKKSVSSS